MKTKIEIKIGKYRSYTCVICRSENDKIVRIQIDGKRAMLRTWICEKCFKRLFAYNNFKF